MAINAHEEKVPDDWPREYFIKIVRYSNENS